MVKFLQRKKGPCSGLLTAALLHLLIAAAAATPAEANWLRKGADLLQSLKGNENQAAALTTPEISEGLKEALRVGTNRVVKQLGREDGFNADPAIHIPLPASLRTVNSMLDKIGMSSLLDDLETRLNRAAEEATPQAGAIFGQAIREMTLDDVKAIYNGPQDAATRYFQSKMSPALAREMKPVIEKSLAEVGAIKTYDNLMGRYRSMPLVPDVKADLTQHVIDEGLKGIFYYLSKEEAAIRQNPAKRTTEILQKVFSVR